MRPCYLEFCGINSFSEPAEIDFSSLLEFGIFGVFGDTGSGKSTILDCIGFALYGNVSRSRTGSIADVINYRSDKAYVRFEFEISFEGKRRRFRVERELKRKNAVQTVKVYEREGENLRAIADGVRESNALLERIVGLEQKDFEKCIALPQGEFAQFVKSQRADRLKLVSRLFDLEEYGEKLVRKANVRHNEAQGTLKILQAKLEPYAEASEEAIRLAAEKITQYEAEKTAAEKALDGAREREKYLSELLKRRAEAESVNGRFIALEAQKGEFELLERELGRLESAAAVIKAEREALQADEALVQADRAFAQAEAARLEAEKRTEALAVWDESAADEEIARLTELKARAEQFGLLQKRLNDLRAEYVREAALFKGFSYETEREELESALSALGEGDFFSFAETHGKSALLRGEYAVFAGELQDIQNAYPETERMIAPLVEKYTALSVGEKTDFTALRGAYEKRESARKEIQTKLLDLEKRNGLYRAHCTKLQQLQTEGERLKTELSAMNVASDALEAERALLAKKRERKARIEERETARRRRTEAIAAHAAAEERAKGAKEGAKRAQERLDEALGLGNFGKAEEARTLIERFGDAEAAKTRVTKYREEYAAVSVRRKELAGEDFSAATAESVQSAREECVSLSKAHEGAVRELALAKDALARGEEALKRRRELEKEIAEAQKQAEIFERLKKLLEGNKFMEFVAEEYLQNVAQNGSRRLLSLTSGRYFLRYDGGFLVGDNLAGGSTRGVYTLSGGETFLVSLSLALALSDEICRKSLRPIEFFFLDEGFGTLDERLVDTVMDSLEKLKGEHFSIGIISHVEELKHRIERKLSVEKATEKHGSRIRA